MTISESGSFNASTLRFTPGSTGTSVIRCTLTVCGTSKTADYRITVQ